MARHRGALALALLLALGSSPAWVGGLTAPKAPRALRPARVPRGALPDFDVAVYELSVGATQAVGSALQGGNLLTLLPLLFLAGLASSVNPCSAAALPAAVASTAALGQGRPGGALGQALAFAAGSSTVLAGLCLGATFLGDQLLPTDQLGWLFPSVAVCMGLALLGEIPLGRLGLQRPELPAGLPAEVQGYGLGVVSAMSSSPCATPVLVTVVSWLATHPALSGYAPAFFLAYALGYNAPLGLAAAGASSLPTPKPWLAGAAILALGTYQLLALADADGAASGLLGLALALASAFALALGLMRSASGPAVTAVAGEVGVYLHSPGMASADFGEKRRAALGALCAGGALAGMQGRTEAATPAATIRRMARESRPLSEALWSGRPVLVDFSATWCPDCLKGAPKLAELKQTYGNDVEFVTLDISSGPGTEEVAWWVREFGVDGIPHVAFVARDRHVPTALIGDVPPEVLRADLEALSRGSTLPYVMYDAFWGGRELRMPGGLPV